MKSIIILLVIILIICLFCNNNIKENYRSKKSNEWETVNNKLCSYTGRNKLKKDEFIQHKNFKSRVDCIRKCQSMNNKPPGTKICKASMWNKRSKICNIFKKKCYKTKNDNNYIINRLKL